MNYESEINALKEEVSEIRRQLNITINYIENSPNEIQELYKSILGSALSAINQQTQHSINN